MAEVYMGMWRLLWKRSSCTGCCPSWTMWSHSGNQIVNINKFLCSYNYKQATNEETNRKIMQFHKLASSPAEPRDNGADGSHCPKSEYSHRRGASRLGNSGRKIRKTGFVRLASFFMLIKLFRELSWSKKWNRIAAGAKRSLRNIW